MENGILGLWELRRSQIERYHKGDCGEIERDLIEALIPVGSNINLYKEVVGADPPNFKKKTLKPSGSGPDVEKMHAGQIWSTSSILKGILPGLSYPPIMNTMFVLVVGEPTIIRSASGSYSIVEFMPVFQTAEYPNGVKIEVDSLDLMAVPQVENVTLTSNLSTLFGEVSPLSFERVMLQYVALSTLFEKEPADAVTSLIIENCKILAEPALPLLQFANMSSRMTFAEKYFLYKYGHTKVYSAKKNSWKDKILQKIKAAYFKSLIISAKVKVKEWKKKKPQTQTAATSS